MAGFPSAGVMPNANADGTVTAPAVAFASEPGLGMYRLAAGVLGLAALGVTTFAAGGVASAVNYVRAVPSVTGGTLAMQATGTDANISFALQPKGAGWIGAQIPNALASGGNGRGTNAVDWQMTRTLATQVASGANAVIGGGLNNIAANPQCTVGGGTNNTANNSNATIGGGSNNIANASAATVGGGATNTASGSNAFVGGGVSNAASGLNSVVAGGNSNGASGIASWCPGGAFSAARGLTGRGAWAATRIAANGDAQCGEFHVLRQTTNATATRLTADNAAEGTANSVNLPDFSTYGGRLLVTAKQTGSADVAFWSLDVAALRNSGAGSVVVYLGAGASIAPTGSNGVNGAALRLTIAADTTNGGIAISGTGIAAQTFNWSARFTNVEATTVS